jgi:predicted Zn-dependent peptidase
MRFHHTVLDNGLRVIAELNDQAHSVAAGFFVKTGSRDESRRSPASPTSSST